MHRKAIAGIVALVALSTTFTANGGTRGRVLVSTSAVRGSDGRQFTATNHRVLSASGQLLERSREYLVVWAGDWNASDQSGGDVKGRATRVAIDPTRAREIDAPDDAPGADFLAVIDVDPRSEAYGKVVNTITTLPVLENEPHHMQYVWRKGQNIFAGGLFSDITYVFDVKALPLVKLTGVNLPQDSPCGSVPDAYWALTNGTAYGTYMGGPDVAGPCRYSNGEVRVGDGFAGSPGSLVHLGADGTTLSESSAATDFPQDNDVQRCPPIGSCANPHGIQVREDLHRVITVDYAEPRNVPTDPIRPVNPNLFRDTARVWDISKPNAPKVVAVSVMPDGPRRERNPLHEEPRGIMETTVTNLPAHRGAFTGSMCGGVIYYTPDITAKDPKFVEVFDNTAASKLLRPSITEGAGCGGGGWLQTSPDDRFLFHVVIGRNPGQLSSDNPGMPRMLFVLDIAKLVSSSHPQCNIDTIREVWDGGHEDDCPAVTGILELPDTTSGGPHWGTLDHFGFAGDRAQETTEVRRLAVSNYFVARSGIDGNHKVCLVTVSHEGGVALDTTFLDENEGTPCVDFNRTIWPHGATGKAKPHSELFVVPDAAF